MSDTKAKPTTVRLDGQQITQLERIRGLTSLAKSTLISLAVNALIDHVERTGKLPLPQARKRNQHTPA